MRPAMFEKVERARPAFGCASRNTSIQLKQPEQNRGPSTRTEVLAQDDKRGDDHRARLSGGRIFPAMQARIDRAQQRPRGITRVLPEHHACEFVLEDVLALQLQRLRIFIADEDLFRWIVEVGN